MAENTGGENRVLYVPEQVSEETYKPLLQEPAVFNTLKMVILAKCVLHSIGDAKLMAERRGMSEEALALIKNKLQLVKLLDISLTRLVKWSIKFHASGYN